MEKQPEDLDLYSFDESKEMDLTKELRHNKEVMLDILEKSPKVGVYKGQTKEDWEIFFKFFIDFLKSEIGPRGVCAKKVRKQLLVEEEKVNKLLAPFNLKAITHIREIYMKIKSFIPCDEYTQMKKIEEARERFVENIQKFEDQNSPMVKAISEGLLKKHGKYYEVQTELSVLKANYIKKLKEADQTLDNLHQILDKKEQYHHLMSAQSYLEPYFNEWKAADSEMGRQNCKTGQKFEETVFKKIIPYLSFKQRAYKDWYFQKHKIEVFTNSSWIPKSLGEIDIALGFKDEKEDRYFITTLIECKSRFFDLRQAHKQVSLQDQGNINMGPTFEELKALKRMKIKIQKEKNQAGSKQKSTKTHAEKTIEGIQKKLSEKKEEGNEVEKEIIEKKNEQEEGTIQEKVEITKKFLSTKYGPAELVPNHHFYIITTLPQNEFILPIESKMKEGIQKFTKNMFVQDIYSEPLYKALLQRFEGTLAPLDWFKDYESQWKGDQSNILVLK